MAARLRKNKWGKDLPWPAGMWKDCWAGKLNWRTFWTNKLSIYALKWDIPYSYCVCHTTSQQQVAVQPYWSPWYSPPLSVRSRPDPTAGTCRQTGENPYGLPFALPNSDCSETFRQLLPLAAIPVGRRPARKTCGLEITAKHERGNLLRD